MAWITSTALKNARLDVIETHLGAGATLKIYTGTAPATCADAATGTLLVTISLPADYFADASGGSKAMQGSWTATAGATGTAGYVRFCKSDGTCVLQTAHGDGLSLDNASITSGQTVTVTSGTFTEA
jgi:hypothetical protein